MPKVSIIVPVYNVEKYLPKCVESILGQSFKDWELLLIDDGSLDGSGRICDGYAKTDERIRVCHKENAGVSSARNYGIELSKGDYVMFVDADDWVDTSCLQACFDKEPNADLYRYGMQSFLTEGEGPQDVREVDETLSLEDYRRLLVSRKTILGVCGGIYKSSIIKEQKIRFLIQYSMGEDWLFNFLFLKNCSSLCIIDKPFYSYNRYNDNGCTNNFSMIKDAQMLEVANLIIQDESLASKSYFKPKADCKVNVYYQALTHALLLCKEFKQLKSYTRKINGLEIKPTLYEIINSNTPLKGKVYLVVSRFVFCWYLLFCIKKN